MTDKDLGWPDLNAYVDGELTAAEAARVAAATAEDPHLARQIARLARLKATIQEEFGAASAGGIDGLAPGPAPAPLRARGRSRPWIAISSLAAGLAALVVGAALFFPFTPERGQPAWRDLAVQLHDGWAGSEAAPGSEPGAGLLLAGLSRLPQAAQLPDLSDARLTVGYLQPLSTDFGEGLHVGYRGTRGCRVSLIILDRADGLSEDPVALGGEDRQAHAWRAGNLGYALLASAMDPNHYGVLLKTVQDASRSYQPLGPETRSALEQSRARARPCAG